MALKEVLFRWSAADSKPLVLRVADPICAEVVPRELTRVLEDRLASETAWLVGTDSHLDVAGLPEALQEFLRQRWEHWVKRLGCEQAGPQLMLQAFLQRLVNGGGRTEREHGLGRRRKDMLIQWPDPRSGRADPRAQARNRMQGAAVGQSAGEDDPEGAAPEQGVHGRCGAESGHWAFFDRREAKSWENRVFRREQTESSKAVTVWGMRPGRTGGPRRRRWPRLAERERPPRYGQSESNSHPNCKEILALRCYTVWVGGQRAIRAAAL